MRADDVKGWLRGMEREEEINTAGVRIVVQTFVKLIQAIISPIKCSGPFWKVIEVVIDTRFLFQDHYDYLHDFLAGRSTGTSASTTYVKLAQ